MNKSIFSIDISIEKEGAREGGKIEKRQPRVENIVVFPTACKPSRI